MTDLVIVSESADGQGGASLAAINSARALAGRGFQIHFFAAKGPAHKSLKDIPYVRIETLADDFDLMSAPLLERAQQSLWNAAASDAFEDFLRDMLPDRTIVHVHSFQVQLSASVVRKAIDLRFPVVMSAHDYGIACPYSGFYNYRTGAPCGKEALSKECRKTLCTESGSLAGKLWHAGKGMLQKGNGRVPDGLDHLILPTEFSRRILAPYLPRTLPTSIIPNPLEFVQEPPREHLPGAPFLFVGRLTREKGGKLLAEAAAKLNAPVVFVGMGPEQFEIAGIRPTAWLMGWLESGAVRDAMRGARALVFPSRLYETQGMAVQEAQSMGLPVIVSDVCAAADSVQNGVTGLLFRSGDVSDLAAKMSTLLDDEVAARMGRAAYDAFWQPARSFAELTAEVYDGVLQRRAVG